MPNPEHITISVRYYNALQEVRRCAEALDMATEGTDEYAKAEDDLHVALGGLLMLEDGADESEES